MGKTAESSAVAVKKAVRARMKAHREAQPADEAAMFSLAAQQALLADAAWTAARQVVLYMPTRGEMDTALLREAAWALGKQVLLPRCRPRQYGFMDFVPCQGPEDLCPGHFDLLEPRADLPALTWEEAGRAGSLHPELMVLPGVAFDRQGYRLGFGGGYYDRALSHPTLADTVRVGFAYSWQVIDSLPVQLWDCHVNALCTEEGLLWL